jgi:hypothetical protein
VLATEQPRIRREDPPKVRRAGRPRTSPLWGLAESAKSLPGVWVALDLPRRGPVAIGLVKSVRQSLADKRYEFKTRGKGEKLTAVYCRFNAGGKS